MRSFEVKFYIRLVVTFICFFHLELSGQTQSKLEIGVRFDAYCIPINDPTLDIVYPKYSVSGDINTSMALYGDFNWWILRNFGLAVGIGVHEFDYEVEFIIPDPNPVFPPIVDAHREWSVLGLSPVLNILWRNKKFRVRAGVTYFEPIKIKQSNVIGTYIVSYVIDDNTVLSTDIAETLKPVPSSSFYNLWQLGVQYEFSKNLSINLGIESTLQKTLLNHYTLKISEYENFQVENREVVNDFEFRVNYDSFTIGLAYKFDLKKKEY